MGVLSSCPSSLPKEAPGTQKQNSQLCTTPGREARRGLLFMCKGFCQKRRQETAKENLATATKNGNRTFQKGSHIPSQTRQLGQVEEQTEKPPGWSGGYVEGERALRWAACAGPTREEVQMQHWETEKQGGLRGAHGPGFMSQLLLLPPQFPLSSLSLIFPHL